MNSLAANQQRAESLAEVVKALGHPMRLRIVAMLCDGDQRVIGMARGMDRPQSAVSQQLRILRMSGLVSAVKTGGELRYTLAEPRLKDLVNCLQGCSR
ncbi:MAG: metalloregulator ArsR/SmtB family transcription factor [Desulfarculaceae bacterium]|nr:metalloregulator ArsR/SmtB family transcription factor [Desulfarculaceae bacterium]MCF8074160.1 metalloregulator ArsR/SmtB family transcription factor [Desulfarculaceae bacterium]MCF8102741.1 metalloregulator ArsR/SmtB family transcription factor [Desulfarculaceae bacterium]MCF8116404.1 metalloregulator ArsR/SmtB family transcription factor [Desulfarculaceae bacterium]